MCYYKHCAYLNGIVVIVDHKNVCLDTNIMILCGLQAEILANIGFCIMAALKIQDGRHKVDLNGTVVIIDPKNVCLDTNIMILCGLQAEISANIDFCIMAALKIQDGRHKV